jgi:glycerophosphoryl diester phosphodiesterase
MKSQYFCFFFAACLAHSKDNPLPPPGSKLFTVTPSFVSLLSSSFVLIPRTNVEDTRPLIITHNGASGVYAGCTDLAYKQAIKDGADIIDCAVQMSKDGVVFCMHSADLSSQTTAATAFVSKSSTVHEIQNKSGIFSFDLSWSEIQTLKRT